MKPHCLAAEQSAEIMGHGTQAKKEAAAAERDKESAKKENRSDRRESSHSKRSRSPVRDRKSRRVSRNFICFASHGFWRAACHGHPHIVLYWQPRDVNRGASVICGHDLVLAQMFKESPCPLHMATYLTGVLIGGLCRGHCREATTLQDYVASAGLPASCLSLCPYLLLALAMVGGPVWSRHRSARITQGNVEALSQVRPPSRLLSVQALP